jgi:hypothetical protein
VISQILAALYRLKEETLRRLRRFYFLQVRQFAVPIIVKYGNLKVRRKFLPKEFDPMISRLKEGKIKVKVMKKNEIIAVDNRLILTKDGNLLLSFFLSGSPHRSRNFWSRFWFGMPAPLWILLDFVLIRYSYRIFDQNPSLVLILIFLSTYSTIFLYHVFDYLKEIRDCKFGLEIYPRWIFVLFPYIIFLSSYIYKVQGSGVLFNLPSIVVLFFAALFLYLFCGTVFHLDEYLQSLPEAVSYYNNRLQEKMQGRKPVCWLMTTNSLEDVLSLDKFNLGLHFWPFLINQTNIGIRGYFEKWKLVLGCSDEESLDQIQEKLKNLWNTLIDTDNMLLPYVMHPLPIPETLSGYCLINYSEERILGINLPKEIADSMTEEADLWEAQDIRDVRYSFLKYHKNVISKMERYILSPIRPIIDPSRIEKDLDIIKSYISSLIRLEGLLFLLKQTFEETKISTKVSEMRQRMKKLREIFDEFLEKSSMILDAENTIKIKQLNRRVLYLTVLIFFASVLQLLFDHGIAFPRVEIPPIEGFKSLIVDLASLFSASFGLTVILFASLTLVISGKHCRTACILALLQFILLFLSSTKYPIF